MAPTKWRDGRVGEVTTYCWKDVELLRRLYAFLKRYGYFVDVHRNAIAVPEAEDW